MTDKVKEGLGNIKIQRRINHFRALGKTEIRLWCELGRPLRETMRRLRNTTAIKEPRQ